MYYIRDTRYNDIGIVDTSDGTIEYVSLSDYKKAFASGVEIKENIILRQVMSESEYLNYLNKMRRKLLSMSKKGEGKEFFVTFSLNDLDDYLKSNGFRLRRTLGVYDYAVTREQFVYLLELETKDFKRGLCLVTLDFYYNLSFTIIPAVQGSVNDWVLWKYPIANGVAHNNFFKVEFKKKLTLPEDRLFLALYRNNNSSVCFVDVADFSKKYLVDDISKLRS